MSFPSETVQINVDGNGLDTNKWKYYVSPDKNRSNGTRTEIGGMVT